MRPDAALADRRRAVRESAEGWRDTGAIDEAGYRAVVAAYPDDRVRLGLGFRVLVGLAAFVGGGAFCGLLAVLFEPNHAITMFALGLAVVFTVATELQVGHFRREQAGAEYATAIIAVTCAALAWASLVDFESTFFIGSGVAVVLAVAAWRWGYALLAGLSGFGLLFAFAGWRFERILWLLAALPALLLILRAARSPGLPPAHRRCATAAGLVLVAGSYFAINIFGVDHRWVEWFRSGGGAAPDSWARLPAIAGTILMPPLILILGVRFRDRWLLAIGALFAAASLVTLRRYHPIGPWWVSMVLGGSACLALAVGLRRWLDAGPSRERSGFTAEPLDPARKLTEAAQLAATLVAMSPAPTNSSAAPFEGGGGRSGGGGATGSA